MLALVLAHPFASLVLAALAYAVAWLVYRLKLRIWLSPSYTIPGPSSPSWLKGNLAAIISAEPGAWHDQQSKIHGAAFRYTGVLGEPRIYSNDPRAFNHLMTNAYKYPKPAIVRASLSKMLGEGILVAEGDVHKRQRRVMSPAFTALATKPLVPIFLRKANELKEILLGGETAVKTKSAAVEDGLVDVMSWLGRATLDVIGLAGFDYDFDSLHQQENELATAFKEMFAATTQGTLLAIMQNFIPMLNKIPTERKRTMKRSMDVLQRVGTGIVQGKKDLILKANVGEMDLKKSDFEGEGKDIISMLIRANMASDVAAHQKLSDAEVLAQVTTFMLAGFETSSTALTWTLHLLAEHPQVQDKLRAELLAVEDDEPSLDTLSGLEYLDAVVRESLRINAPVANTVREAAEDDVIPLSEPIIDRNGNKVNEIKVGKGSTVFIGILNMNRSPKIWGEDAHDFVPERWIKGLPNAVMQGIEAPYANLATFLAGPRGCIGWRFALAEIKAFLFVLLRNIKFENPSPALEYIHRSALVQRPLIKGKEAEGYQMRLKLTSLKA